MANKTFRRVLSIIMCAAMLVSVFAVSFNVSAADETVYDWDFTDTANGTDYLTDLQSKSTTTAGSLKGSTSYSSDGYLEVTKTNDNGAYLFNTPDGYTPSSLTITTPNNDDTGTGFSKKTGVGSALIGFSVANEKVVDYISIGAFASYNNKKASINIRCYGGYTNVYRVNDQNWGDQSLSLDTSTLLGVAVPEDSFGKIEYKWTVKPNGDSAATVECEVTYTDDDGEHTGKVGPLNFSADNLQKRIGSGNYSSVPAFSSAFGIRGKVDSSTAPAKFYAVKAVYTAAGEVHQHTAAAERKDVKAATCTEPGYTGDVVCAECGKVMEKGTVIPALGHTPDGEGVVTEPTCTEAGYTTFHCSVCDKDYTEAGADALGHDYQWVVTRPATETETGLEEHKCSRCGDVDDQKEIPVLEPEYKPEVKIASASVIVDDGINLKIDISYQDIDEESLKLTVDGKEYTLTELTDYRSVIVSKYAHQMTDKFTVTLTATGKDGKEYNDIIADYSIAKNLEDIFEKSNEETKTLIAKLANYGAAAQKYNAAANGADAGELANAFLNGEYATDAAAYETMSDCERTGKFAAEGSLNYANAKGGLTLALQSNVAMVVKAKGVELEEGQTLWVSVQSNNKGEFKIKLEKDGDCYKAILSDIAFAPGEYKDEVKLSLVLGNDKGEFAATNSGEITYSVGAYIYKMCSEGTATAELKDLLNAMSEYYTAAVAYNAAIS